MDCVFCRIASGEIPASVVAQTDHALAFRDLNPQAPVHVLVIPRQHVASAAQVTDPLVFAQVFDLARSAADQLGLADAGYRLVVNVGRHGGQSVDHLHVHLLGGRQLHWPPG